MTDFKPMLAGKFDADKQRFPAFVSPKLDGIRAVVRGGKLLSRKLIEIPNRFISASLDLKKMEGYDGELIVGSPTASDCYNTTLSGVMSHDGEPDFTFFAFDHVSDGPWRERIGRVAVHQRTQITISYAAWKYDDLLDYEQTFIGDGYEGAMIRDPEAVYKFGRSTTREGGLLKLKRFEDSEALVLDAIEEMANGNEATKDNLGRTKRSTAKAGKTGKDRMGRLLVRDVHTGVEFEVGTGFTDEQRAEWWIWAHRNKSPRVIKYKFFPVGVKDKPRHPVYLGLRDPKDMS